MPTHLYCLLPAGSDTAAPADAGPVRALQIGGIVAWVGDIAADHLRRDRKGAAREAIAHDQIIGRALGRGITPVPSSLADPYLSDAHASADISSRATEIHASLALVEGTVEMAVILALRPDVQGSATPSEGREGAGRSYLEGLRDLPARMAGIADDVDQKLREIAIATSRRTDGPRVGLSHLIKRGLVGAYRTAALTCVSDRYRMVVDGPRAPYSFAVFSPDAGQGPRPPRGAA